MTQGSTESGTNGTKPGIRRWVKLLGSATLLAFVGIGVAVWAELRPDDPLASSSASPTPSRSEPIETDDPSTSPRPTPSQSSSPENNSDSATNSPSPSVASPSTLYLKDLDDSQIVRDPHWVWESDGTAAINGVEYLDSLLYQFQNCSECDESLEFKVPAGYSRLTGTVGLEDSSRHDDVIDGIVNFAVYDTSGNQIFPTTVIEYPQAVPVDIKIDGQARLRINMTRGSNDEIFVLGDMALVK